MTAFFLSPLFSIFRKIISVKMKKSVFLFISITLLCNSLVAQQTINDTIVHDGLNRSFILYIPEIYSGDEVPLIVNLHGYTSNAFEQMVYGDFRSIADTANFLLVHPMGTDDPSGNPYWNAEFGGDTDDIGFLEALIDSLDVDYNIDLERVYFTGMSNGGFMSYTLACNLSNRIAAIASVTGTMQKSQLVTCSPQHPMPVMEFHGTADVVVPYDGNFLWASTPEVIDYWCTYNQCISSPEVTVLPDVDPEDGCTVELYEYYEGNNGSRVVHYKIIGGGHTWPGSIINTGNGNTNHDINASVEIWNFFRQYDLNGLINQTGIAPYKPSAEYVISPNPASDYFAIENLNSLPFIISVFNSNGVLITEDIACTGKKVFHTNTLKNGIYIIRLYGLENKNITIKKLIVL